MCAAAAADQSVYGGGAYGGKHPAAGIIGAAHSPVCMGMPIPAHPTHDGCAGIPKHVGGCAGIPTLTGSGETTDRGPGACIGGACIGGACIGGACIGGAPCIEP